jgi:hypothetical protein
MEPMEVFKIEVTGEEEFGAKKYRELIMDILQDLGLIRSIGKLYVYIDIRTVLPFVFLRTGIPPLRVRDVGGVLKVEGSCRSRSTMRSMADLLKYCGPVRKREGGQHAGDT